MSPLRMVHLATVQSEFEARVVAARLGAEGVVWELRGISSVYPVGAVDVFVESEALASARDMLLGAEIDAVFADAEFVEAVLGGQTIDESVAATALGQPAAGPRHPWQGTALAVGVLLLIVLLSLRPLLGR